MVVDDYTHGIKRAFGFWTSTKTRPVILSELIRAVREDITTVSDETTLQEMLTFVRGEDYKPRAEEGAHDDCVMALAIAHHIRPQQRYTVEAGRKAGGAVWDDSMWEDYNNAGPEEREYLIKKWGEPKR